MAKRVFVIVLDSLGIGEMPDADAYGDAGSDTLFAISRDPAFHAPHLRRLGLFNIQGVRGEREAHPAGAFARMAEASRGKDTTIGHWEIAGVVSAQPMPTYPHGFPAELIAEYERRIGRGTLGNLPYSGTEVIRDYGREHVATGKPIVYTSADSVFQIAAHEGVIPIEELYRISRIARELLTGEHAVGRVIARPFEGEYPFRRTTNRHDFSLTPPRETMLDRISAAGLDAIGVGKIGDIFAGKGITATHPTHGNAEGMQVTSRLQAEDFHGLGFVNLVDTDMLYGHRNDVPGYAGAISAFDAWLGGFLPRMRPDDLLMITADHGCDPSTPSTDHSREYAPLLLIGDGARAGCDLGTRPTFADIAETVLDALSLPTLSVGTSLLPMMREVGA